MPEDLHRSRYAPEWWAPLHWNSQAMSLIPVQKHHATSVKRVLTDEIARWLDIGSGEDMRSGTRVWAFEADELARLRTAYRYLIFRDNRFSGAIELRSDATRGHLGYWLRKSARGCGTATVANQMLLVVAFKGLRLNAVDWVANENNTDSIAVIMRLNAKHLGTVAKHSCDGRVVEMRFRLSKTSFFASFPQTPRAVSQFLTAEN